MFRDPYDPWGRPRARPPQAVPVRRPAPEAARPAPPPPAPPPPEPPVYAGEPPGDARAQAATTREDALRNALDEVAATRRRLEREHARLLEATRAGVVQQMLPILDNLDRSIASASPSARGDGLLDGVRLVRTQFEDALARSGLERIESKGARFDPSVHEAIGVVEVEDPDLDGVVVDEWQRGYRLGDRIVRAPKVRVGRLAA